MKLGFPDEWISQCIPGPHKSVLDFSRMTRDPRTEQLSAVESSVYQRIQCTDCEPERYDI